MLFRSGMTLDEKLFYLDRVEILTREDEERAAELGVDTNLDMPSGFYIYNANNYTTALDVSDDTKYLVVDWDLFSDPVSPTNYISLTKKEFIAHNEDSGYNPLYHVYTKGGYATKIEEQYIP